jgi:DNA-binding winged helix-turn-helix (wHTH) protein
VLQSPWRLLPAKENGLLYLFEDCVLDTDRRELRRGAEALSVAPQVFDLLAYLIRNRERVVSKGQAAQQLAGLRLLPAGG